MATEPLTVPEPNTGGGLLLGRDGNGGATFAVQCTPKTLSSGLRAKLLPSLRVMFPWPLFPAEEREYMMIECGIRCLNGGMTTRVWSERRTPPPLPAHYLGGESIRKPFGHDEQQRKEVARSWTSCSGSVRRSVPEGFSQERSHAKSGDRLELESKGSRVASLEARVPRVSISARKPVARVFGRSRKPTRDLQFICSQTSAQIPPTFVRAEALSDRFGTQIQEQPSL